MFLFDSHSAQLIDVCWYEQFLRTLSLLYFRPAVLTNGIWDQVRVDSGKEFYLCLFMQEILAAHRYNTVREPYKQTPSTKVSS